MCLFVEVITVSIKGQMIFPSTEEIANPRFCQAHEVCFRSSRCYKGSRCLWKMYFVPSCGSAILTKLVYFYTSPRFTRDSEYVLVNVVRNTIK